MAGLDKHFDGVKQPSFYCFPLHEMYLACDVCMCIGGAIILSRSFIRACLISAGLEGREGDLKRRSAGRSRILPFVSILLVELNEEWNKREREREICACCL